MNTIIINGKTIVSSGRNVTVKNNKVYVDGKLVEDCDNFKEKEIHITINGDVNKLSVNNGNIDVNGNTGSIDCDCGDISVSGDVNGDVSVDCGDVHCGNISGDTNVDCGSVKHGIIKGIKKIVNRI